MPSLLYPPYLQWEINSECNHKCIHCYNYWRADSIWVEECTQADEIAQKIIERKPLYVAITGGEPLLVFDKVKNCITKFVESGITCSISTNGTLITDEVASFLSENNVDLVISLPSIDPMICDAVCGAKNVVQKLSKVWDILKKYHITTNINVVVNKLNISTLFQTLEAICKLGFIARVGMAQKPINASKEYLKYELDKNDFKYIVNECIRAKKELNLDLDFSVCIPDCAFDNIEQMRQLEKGSCFAGTIAYAVCTNGDVKACQCDTKVYGNILTDDFSCIYKSMSEWRNNALLPKECESCTRLFECQGGCRVEAYASQNRYDTMSSFADINNFSVTRSEEIEEEIKDYSLSSFVVSEEAVFLKDLECTRVSVGIVAVFLEDEFAVWLKRNKHFSFQMLSQAAELSNTELNIILEMLLKNGIIKKLED